MGYKNKSHGDRLNAARAAAYNTPRKMHCPWCAINGAGHHPLVLTPDGTLLHCPQCGDGRPATDADRRLYGVKP